MTLPSATVSTTPYPAMTISVTRGPRAAQHRWYPSVYRSAAPGRLPEQLQSQSIKTYDGERDPKAWLRVYTTAIRAAGGSPNAMANFLPVVLSPTVQDWLTGLPENSIDSWGDLCTTFISNFQGTYEKPGVDWDLY